MSYLQELDRVKADLAERFPGWQVWYVPHNGGRVVWCARPHPLINSASPERLAFDIHAAIAEGAVR